MKTLVILVLFVGMFLIIQGVYDEKLKAAEENKQVVYKFIPRTYYEEQLQDSDLETKMASMFSKASTWNERAQLDNLMPDKKNENSHLKS
jgi:hypothetical protein